jgi:DNA-binding GntR family transcriptional regulator
VESRLATEHGVSRTRIRDGLARLEAELLVAPFGGRGLMVRPLSNKDIEEAYAMRLLLEGYAAKQAASNITHDELETLTEINDRMVALESEGHGKIGDERRLMIVAVADLNNDFHGLIQTASRNSRLRELLRTVVDVPLVFKSFFWYTDSELREAADDHRRIIEALRNHDPEGSEATIRAHITRGLNTLRRELPTKYS